MKIIIITGIILVVVITVVFSQISSSPHYIEPSSDNGGCDNYDAKSFFRCGGRSWLSILPQHSEINATIGSSVQLPITLMHIASTHPLPFVKVHYAGLSSGEVPSCAPMPQISSEVINFTSSTQSTSDEFLLDAGESKVIFLKITIPSDWPKCVNSPMFWHLDFMNSDNYNPKDFLMDNTGFSIRVMGR